MVFKNIKNNEKTFLFRLSQNLKKGSFKLHLIIDDDIKPHNHPWDFTSLILFGGYKETSYLYDKEKDTKYEFSRQEFGWLSKNIKKSNTYHLITLRRLFGIKIPCLTIGYYSEKKQLCSLCQELGYCKSNKK